MSSRSLVQMGCTHSRFTSWRLAGFEGVLPKASEVRNGVHVRVDGFHVGRALGDLVDDAVMKADFQAPDGDFRVVTGVREGVFVHGAFPDAFHEGAFVGDVDFFRLVVEAHLQAVGFTKGVGFTASVDGGTVQAFEHQVTEAVVDADGFGTGDEVAGKVLGGSQPWKSTARCKAIPTGLMPVRKNMPHSANSSCICWLERS